VVKKHIQFIVNPVSGYNNHEDILSLVKDNLDHDAFSYDYTLTERKGHATELAKAAVSKKVDIVVACGGDGTVNEVAAPLVHTDTRLAILPNGSGNGFAMHIGMGRNSKRAIHRINEAVEMTIDSCTVNDEFFLNLAGIGFDALIAYKTEHGDSKRGLQMYVSTISKEMMKFKAEHFDVKMDGESVKGHFTVVAVANAAMYGYNFNIAPFAKLRDGLLDIVFIKEAPLLRTIGASWRLLNKSIYKSPLVEVKKSKEVRLRLDKPYYYHVDGESKRFEDELHFKVIPKSLKILLPKDKAEVV